MKWNLSSCVSAGQFSTVRGQTNSEKASSYLCAKFHSRIILLKIIHGCCCYVCRNLYFFSAFKNMFSYKVKNFFLLLCGWFVVTGKIHMDYSNFNISTVKSCVEFKPHLLWAKIWEKKFSICTVCDINVCHCRQTWLQTHHNVFKMHVCGFPCDM